MTPLRLAATAYEYERGRWVIQERHPRYLITRSDYESETTDIIFETEDHGQANIFFDRLRNDACMRAALLALAECDLSEQMIDLGWEDNQGTPDFDRDFTALIRFIANEGKTDG